MYPPIWAVLEMVGLDKIGVYIACNQNTIAKYIANFHIMDLCMAAEQKPGLRMSRQLWEHPALDSIGIREGHIASEVEIGREELEGEGEYDREGWR